MRVNGNKKITFTFLFFISFYLLTYISIFVHLCVCAVCVRYAMLCVYIYVCVVCRYYGSPQGCNDLPR